MSSSSKRSERKIEVDFGIDYEKKLGQGGFGVVYEANPRGLPPSAMYIKMPGNKQAEKERKFVVKVIPKLQYDPDEEIIWKKQRYIVLTKESESEVFLLLEKIPGKSLLESRDKIKALPIKAQLSLVLDLALRINELHHSKPERQTIIHGDLHSNNIKIEIDRERGYKLCLLADDTIIEKNCLYVRKVADKLTYSLITSPPNEKKLMDIPLEGVPTPSEELTQEILDSLKAQIFEVTSKNNHTNVYLTSHLIDFNCSLALDDNLDQKIYAKVGIPSIPPPDDGLEPFPPELKGRFYEIVLIPEGQRTPPDAELKKDLIYIKKIGDKLAYTVITHTNEIVKDVILDDLSLPKGELTQEKINLLKNAIFLQAIKAKHIIHPVIGVKSDIYMLGYVISSFLGAKELPTLFGFPLKDLVMDFIQDMKSDSYDQRPDSDNVLKFFNTLNLLTTLNNYPDDLPDKEKDLKKYLATLWLIKNNSNFFNFIKALPDAMIRVINDGILSVPPVSSEIIMFKLSEALFNQPSLVSTIGSDGINKIIIDCMNIRLPETKEIETLSTQKNELFKNIIINFSHILTPRVKLKLIQYLAIQNTDADFLAKINNLKARKEITMQYMKARLDLTKSPQEIQDLLRVFYSKKELTFMWEKPSPKLYHLRGILFQVEDNKSIINTYANDKIYGLSKKISPVPPKKA